MSAHIFYMAKFFENRKYAEEFMDGNLYLNSARFFANLEDAEDGRADRHEGLFHTGLGIQTIVKINDFALHRGNGLIRSTMRMDSTLDHHILCVYAANPEDKEWFSRDGAPPLKDPAKIEAFRQALLPDPRLEAMGPWCVVLDAERFVKRIVYTCRSQNLGLEAKLVNYYDPESFEGSFERGRELFHKEDQYAYQREYRFVFSGVGPLDEACRLNIGSLTSTPTPIAQLVRFDQLDGLLEIRAS